MSAADLAVALATVAMIAAFIALLAVMHGMLRVARELRALLERIERDTVPLVSEMQVTVEQAGAEVDRVDGLLDAAASIQHTVDGASRLTYVAFARPLIKVVAFFRGLRRGTTTAVSRSSRRRRRRARLDRPERSLERAA